jgi:DNA-binding NarL/FixJ family response regulator
VGSLVVVDDNRSFAELARVLLERQGRRVLGVAGNSAEALELVAELRPGIVLIDLMLGDESGLDLAQVLTGNTSCDPPVVILISSYPLADVAELVAASPAAGFLPKSELSSDAIRHICHEHRFRRLGSSRAAGIPGKDFVASAFTLALFRLSGMRGSG